MFVYKSLGLGNTVSDIDISKGKVFSKTKFSMVVPEVEEILQTNAGVRKSVVLFGIEVSINLCVLLLCVCLYRLKCVSNRLVLICFSVDLMFIY